MWVGKSDFLFHVGRSSLVLKRYWGIKSALQIQHHLCSKEMWPCVPTWIDQSRTIVPREISRPACEWGVHAFVQPVGMLSLWKHSGMELGDMVRWKWSTAVDGPGSKEILGEIWGAVNRWEGMSHPMRCEGKKQQRDDKFDRTLQALRKKH